MTKKVATRSFCNDPRVRIVLFFKDDGSVQEVNCSNSEEYCDEESIVLNDIVLIARLMLDGSVDYPYSSNEVVSRKSTTIIDVATQDRQFQTMRIPYSQDEVDESVCRNAQVPLDEHRKETDSCDLCFYSYGTGRPRCVRICYTTITE